MLSLFVMASKYPRIMILVSACLLIFFSITALFSPASAIFQLIPYEWAAIGFCLLCMLSGIASLTIEWFNPQSRTRVILITATAILLAIIGIFYAVNGILYSVIIIFMIETMLLLGILKHTKFGIHIIFKLTFIILFAAALILWLTTNSSFTPTSSPRWFLIALTLLLICIAGASITWFLYSHNRISRVISYASILPFLFFLVLFSIPGFPWENKLLTAFILLILIFFDQINDRENDSLYLTSRWYTLLVLLVLVFLSLTGLMAYVTRPVIGTFESVSTNYFLQRTSQVVSITEFLLLLIALAFIESIIRIISRQFEEIQRLAEIHDPNTTEQSRELKLYFRGSTSSLLLQSFRSLLKMSPPSAPAGEELDTTTETVQEKKLRSGIRSLSDLSEKLESSLDQPVSAQYLVTALQATVKCALCLIYINNADEHRLVPLASAGPEVSAIRSGFRLRPNEGLIGKAVRLQKEMLFQSESETISDPRMFPGVNFQSYLILPLFREGFLEGIILLCDRRSMFFTQDQMEIVKAAGSQLLAAWARNNFIRSLANMIESSSSLSNINELDSILQKVAEIAKRIIRNQFTAVIVSIQDQSNLCIVGKAPELRTSIERNLAHITNYVLRFSESQTIRDIRRDIRTSMLKIDDPDLRTMLISPICIRGVNIGALLLFGKRKGFNFSEQDTFLANLLSLQSAALIEGCMLDQELRNNLVNTQLLHGLNLKITQANDLGSAVNAITETAFRISQAETCGLVLYSLEGKVEGQSNFSQKHSSIDHPKELIQQAMKRKEVIEKAENQFYTTFCFPIQTSRRVYGGLWLNLANAEQNREKIIPEITNLVSQAAIALERSILLKESREKAEQISLAYYQLQTTYDQTLMALVSAIDLRDRETEGHSIRVAQLAVAIGMELNLNPDDLKSLERGSLLHDIGKIGIGDDILHKPEKLTMEEWKIMHQHPKIGMQIVESIPFLKEAVTVVANHQERWDGSGYPKGLKGKDIPILARIFAVADVFDALISDRPYHEKISPQDAVEYLKFQANILFDSDVIKAFTNLYERPSFLKQLGFYEL